MQVENLNELKEALKYRGFGESLFKDLESNMNQGVPDFTLNHTSAIDRDKLDSTLHFKKHKTEDKYYFNSYDALLTKQGQQDQAGNTHTFYYNQNISVKEAYNLLNYGKQTAVYKPSLFNKNGEQYSAWVTLDLNGEKDKNNNYPVKIYHEEKYYKEGFDLKQQLEKSLPVPVKEVELDASLDNLVRSLKRGNCVAVTISHNDEITNGFLMVNAERGRIEVYTAGMQLIESNNQQQEKKQGQKAEGNSQDVKKNANNNWNRQQVKKGLSA